MGRVVLHPAATEPKAVSWAFTAPPLSPSSSPHQSRRPALLGEAGATQAGWAHPAGSVDRARTLVPPGSGIPYPPVTLTYSLKELRLPGL